MINHLPLLRTSLALLVALALSGLAHAQESPLRWKYTANGAAGFVSGSFATRGDGHWVEAVSNGDIYRFVEATRNAQYVELLDRGRDVSVRIYPGECLIRTPSTNGQFLALYRGVYGVPPAPALRDDAPVIRPANSLAGVWDSSVTSFGNSRFTFTPIGNNQYRSQESGLGNSTGIATVVGNSIRIEWSTAGGFRGVANLEFDANGATARGINHISSGRTGDYAIVLRRAN